MAGRYHHRLLGVPLDRPAPDYFALLGLERDSVEKETVERAVAERLERLPPAPASERAIAQHLKRELKRASGTLLDPKRRAEHAKQVQRGRLEAVPRCVGKLI